MVIPVFTELLSHPQVTRRDALVYGTMLAHAREGITLTQAAKAMRMHERDLRKTLHKLQTLGYLKRVPRGAGCVRQRYEFLGPTTACPCVAR